MKKTILLIVACVITFATVRAQSSEVEATTKLTKAEQFKAKSDFIKEDLIYKYQGQGVRLFAKLFVDLKTGEQLTALEFYPSAGQQIMNSMISGVVSEPLGYLDMDAIDDLLLALETIVEIDKTSNKQEEFSVTYITPSGIDVFFNRFEGNAYGICTFRKKWYSIDDYGIQTAKYSEGWISILVSALPKLISSIREAQIVCEKELSERTPLTMNTILAKVAAKKEAEAEAEAEEFRKAEEIKAEEARIAEEKRKEANATDLYKKEVTTSIVQVQQEYTKLELTDSPIFTAYKKAISKLMQSRVLRDWETLDVINTVMQNLIKENCSIDKTALETQLAEKTTPEEIIEVFKASL